MEKGCPRVPYGSPSSVILLMHRFGSTLLAADYGSLQEDYNSVAANPSFDGHGLLMAPCGR